MNSALPPPRFGVIADTHGFLDPAIPRLFAGVDRILHGGDIGSVAIIRQLEEIAPVTAVLGNNDLGLPYRETEVVECGERRLGLRHIVPCTGRGPAVEALPFGGRLDAIIFGHTHEPFVREIDGILFLNPGYAGRARFGLPRSVAILHAEAQGLRVEARPL